MANKKDVRLIEKQLVRYEELCEKKLSKLEIEMDKLQQAPLITLNTPNVQIEVWDRLINQENSPQ